jgi:hypothetical protein
MDGLTKGGHMKQETRPDGQMPKLPRKSIRLTFRVANGKVELISHERLEMIAPPQPGEQPEVGRHGGFWMEMRDGKGRVLSYKLIDPSQLNSVEVHSPDGKIGREFSDTSDKIFEVLLPEEEDARTVALMGEPLISRKGEKKRDKGSGEIAQFRIPGRGKGGE